MMEFARPDGSLCGGYLADAGQGKPGVIVIQEWWGLNGQIRSVADRFAAAGYAALAPDLYKGRVAQDADEASHMMNGLDFAGATFQDIRGAVQHLHSVCGAKKVAVMGFCMGGALTVASAVHVPDVAAGVCFYGMPPKAFADPAQIRVPFQGHFANQDDWVSPELVNETEVAMRAAGQTPDFYRYDAQHAFFNQLRPEVFDPAASELAWARTLAFLAKHLG
ncbi:dienelactone hydrolase family protein [Burkholderiaceae bacterium DAT-1]|nr:dienelactone hydrolase family protein [Burkholderiaceae bacterium DAT-1]